MTRICAEEGREHFVDNGHDPQDREECPVCGGDIEEVNQR